MCLFLNLLACWTWRVFNIALGDEAHEALMSFVSIKKHGLSFPIRLDRANLRHPGLLT